MNIAVIDDDVLFGEKLKFLLSEWSLQAKQSVKVAVFYDAIEFLTDFMKTGRWSIIISDVQMPELDGLELAKRIREADKCIPLIFVSSFVEYSLQGYEVNAVRFLHKDAPNFKAKLFESLFYAQKTLKEQPEDEFSFKSDGNFYKLKYSDIYYFEQSAHIVRVHTEKEILCYRTSMKDLINSLPAYFVVTSRSHIVNLHKIISVTNTGVILRNNETVQVSGSNRPALICRFKENRF